MKCNDFHFPLPQIAMEEKQRRLAADRASGEPGFRACPASPVILARNGSSLSWALEWGTGSLCYRLKGPPVSTFSSLWWRGGVLDDSLSSPALLVNGGLGEGSLKGQAYASPGYFWGVLAFIRVTCSWNASGLGRISDLPVPLTPSKGPLC